jgi:uncharacterized phage-associated protein
MYPNKRAKEMRKPMPVRFDFDIEKAIAATIYIGSREPRPTELTQAKLFKMLYFADRDHLVRYCRPITGDWYSAMKDGPVPSNFYDAFKHIDKGTSEDSRLLAKSIRLDKSHQYPWIEIQAELDPLQLSLSDTQSLDRIAEEYGHMTFTRVRAIAHDTAAWANAWDKKHEESDAAAMLFEDFFEDEANALAGAKEEMLENFGLKMILGYH